MSGDVHVQFWRAPGGAIPPGDSPQHLRAVPAGGRAGHGERNRLPRPAAEADGERSQERGGPPIGAGLPGLQLHGRTDAPAGRLAEGARPVQGAGSGTDASHQARQIPEPASWRSCPATSSGGGATSDSARSPMSCSALTSGPGAGFAPSPGRTGSVGALAFRGAAPPRGQQDPGGQRPLAAPMARGGSAIARHCRSRYPTPSSAESASHPSPQAVPPKSVEPPCTDPYARWCGRGGAARLPPIPIPLRPFG